MKHPIVLGVFLMDVLGPGLLAVQTSVPDTGRRQRCPMSDVKLQVDGFQADAHLPPEPGPLSPGGLISGSNRLLSPKTGSTWSVVDYSLGSKDDIHWDSFCSE